MNYKKLIAGLVCSLVLFFSWYSCPFTRVLWDSLDKSVFLYLNGTLAEKSWWSFSWAIANNRSFDLAAAFFMLIILIQFARKNSSPEDFNKKISTIATAMIYVVISSQLIKLTIRSLDRESASKMIEGAVFLSDLYPGIDPKDASSNSFPGDHAIILFSFTALMFYYGKLRYGMPALLISIFFGLPRLFSGAHWFTDIAVGSISISLISYTIYVYTPLHIYGEEFGNLIYNKLPLVNILTRWFTSKNDSQTA